jgi:predicted N-acetyltransferase YhbS
LTEIAIVTIVLGYLAVHPSHQRQGIGPLLIESGLQAAEKMGLDVFVSSTKAGRRVYQKAGFTLLGEINQDYSEWGGEGDDVTTFFSKVVKN